MATSMEDRARFADATGYVWSTEEIAWVLIKSAVLVGAATS